MLVEWIRHGKPTVIGAVSGCVAGLVAITPAAGYVTILPSVATGLIGGIVCYGAVATGLWATNAVNPDGANGLFYGETSLFFAQKVLRIGKFGDGKIIVYELSDAVRIRHSVYVGDRA